jgi:protein-disulfide isomerase
MPEEQHNQTPVSTPPVITPQIHTASSYRSSLGIPIAIVIAAALIAGAIVFTGMQKSNGSQVGNGKNTEQQTGETVVAPVTEKDHIRGNPNAPIMIVEYSDYDCPFCRAFHDTMTKIMNEYGADGKVAWVFRQLPLEQLHPNAPKIAEASECVASIGGNEAFWKFSDALNNSRKIVYGTAGNITSVEPTNMNRMNEFVAAAGVDQAKFTQCLESGKFTAKVEEDVKAGFAAGAKGTPYSILIVGDQQGIINGAQPYEVVKKMIDTVITQMEGGDTTKN